MFNGPRISIICVNNYPKRCNNIQFICNCKLLYMFRVVSPPIIRSSYHCIYSIWHYCGRFCRCSDKNSWRYYSKHVEQFAVTNKLYIVASCWIIIDTFFLS